MSEEERNFQDKQLKALQVIGTLVMNPFTWVWVAPALLTIGTISFLNATKQRSPIVEAFAQQAGLKRSNYYSRRNAERGWDND